MRLLVLATLLLISHVSSACENPKSTTHADVMARLVMNRLTPESFQRDQEIKRQYGCKYIIADAPDSPALERAQPIAGGLPDTPLAPDGEPVYGKVLVGYIIGMDGQAHDPVVLESTSPILTETALAAMKEWRFVPGKFNGRTVATLAAQNFVFGAPR
jgi:hypothetical protein